MHPHRGCANGASCAVHLLPAACTTWMLMGHRLRVGDPWVTGLSLLRDAVSKCNVMRRHHLTMAVLITICNPRIMLVKVGTDGNPG